MIGSGKIIKELNDENKLLQRNNIELLNDIEDYKEKLIEITSKYEDIKERFDDIEFFLSLNQNGSVENLQNKIRSLLKGE